MKKKNKNSGSSAGQVEAVPNSGSVTPISDKLGQVKLSDHELSMIQALEKNLGDAKFHLANVQFQIMTMETERLRAAQKVAEAKQAMDELVRNTAKAHHIDPDDPAKGRWDLNTSNGVFTRVA